MMDNLMAKSLKGEGSLRL